MNANCIREDAPRIRRNVPCLLVAGTKEERERKIKGQKLDQHGNRMVVEEQVLATSAWKTLPPGRHIAPSLTSSGCLLKCHLIHQIIPEHLKQNETPSLSHCIPLNTPLLFVASLPPDIIYLNCYLFIFYLPAQHTLPATRMSEQWSSHNPQ